MMLTDSLVLEIASANSSQGEDVWMLNESQLSDFASAVIAANNAKVLEGIKPDTHCFDNDTKRDVWSYSAAQVAPLIQRVKDLEAQAEMDSEQINSLIKKVPPRPDEQSRKPRFA